MVKLIQPVLGTILIIIGVMWHIYFIINRTIVNPIQYVLAWLMIIVGITWIAYSMK